MTKRTIALLLSLFLLWLPLTEGIAGQSGDAPCPDPVGVIPFRLTNNQITLTLCLNESDKPLSFILDTGADGMAIRKSLADSLGLHVSRSHTAGVVGGSVQVDISSGNKVLLADGTILENQNIALFETLAEFDGIIGLNLIYRYITKVDFDEQRIYLYAPDRLPCISEEAIPLPISNMGALLLIPAELNLTGKETVTGNFIMDTGANYELILFSRFVRKNRLLLSGFKPEGQASTISMGHSTPVFHGKAHSLKVGGEIERNDFQVVLQASAGSDLTPENSPDGSIGIAFFSRFNFVVDVRNDMVYLEPVHKLGETGL